MMFLRSVGLLGLLSLAEASPCAYDRSGSLYFLENNPAGANLVSVRVSSVDGTLSDPVRTSTGGKGLIGLTAQGPATVDTLASQDAVAISGSRLVTVNPGSNTVALFEIQRDDPSHPEMIGSPVSSVGTFPNTVAISGKLGLACVANSGDKPGVACYDVTSKGLKPVGSLMPLPINQTYPPVGPANGASDIAFNPSNTALFVTVKGDGKNPGYVYAYPIIRGQVSSTPVVSRPAGLLVQFSLSFVDDRTAYVADPAYGASMVSISYPDLKVTVAKKITVANQGATCWSEISARTGSAFVFDGAAGNITTLDIHTGDIKYTIPSPAGSMGHFDSVLSASHLYSLDAADRITVYSLPKTGNYKSEPTFVQTFDLTSFGNRQFFQGLAYYSGWW